VFDGRAAKSGKASFRKVALVW